MARRVKAVTVNHGPRGVLSHQAGGADREGLRAGHRDRVTQDVLDLPRLLGLVRQRARVGEGVAPHIRTRGASGRLDHVEAVVRSSNRVQQPEWQYEWYEAFIKLMKNEELIFSDYETNGGKKEYSIVGGCYYTAKMAVLDYLLKIKKQSGLLILREAYDGYVPLGVFNVRENIKEAMLRPYLEFETLKDALRYAGTKLKIPISRYVKQGTLLNEMLHTKQTTLDMYFKSENNV